MIQNFADWLIYSLIGLGAETKLGSALNFFIYDSIKILLLLFLIVFKNRRCYHCNTMQN